MNNLTLDDPASFTWGYSNQFFLETDKGNFVWEDPDYDGDNTIRPFSGDYKEWCKQQNIPFGRDKGKHLIRNYCGDDVKILGT